MSSKSPYKISLNLSGGGARGLAHIGVLRAFEENDIEVDLLMGVSMGAVIAANYALYKNIDRVERLLVSHIESEEFQHSLLGTWRPKAQEEHTNIAKNFLMKFNRLYKQTELYGRIFLSSGILNNDDIKKTILPIIPQVDFSDLKIPFACVAVNLETGVRHVFNSGDTALPVLASLSMPLVFPPVEIDGCMYTDGGIVDRIGVDSAFDLGVKKIIAVDVSNSFFGQNKLKTALDIMLQSEEISARYRSNYQLSRAAIVITPIKRDIHWAEYHNHQSIIDGGYESALSKIDDIKRLIRSQKSILRFFMWR